MADTKDFNFIGNIEGNQLLGNCPADVVVTDGFTGNIVLKEAEGLYKIIRKKGLTDDFFEKFNFENTGAVPVLGVNGIVLIGHGIYVASSSSGIWRRSTVIPRSSASCIRLLLVIDGRIDVDFGVT